MSTSCEILGPFSNSGLVALGRSHVVGLTIDGLDGTNSLRVVFHEGGGTTGKKRWSFTVPGAALAGGRNFNAGPVYEDLYMEITTSGTGAVYVEVAPQVN